MLPDQSDQKPKSVTPSPFHGTVPKLGPPSGRDASDEHPDAPPSPDLPVSEPAVALQLSEADASEGGKGGQGGNRATLSLALEQAEAPPLPPSPALPTPFDGTVATRLKPFSAEGTFFPAPAENPVLAALKVQGLYLDALSGGEHTCRCAFEHEHPTPDQTYTATYYEPDVYNPFGRFRCSANHPAPKGIVELLDRFEINPRTARCKAMIRVQAGDLNPVLGAAEYALAQTGQFYQSEDTIVTLRQKHDGVGIEVLDDAAATRAVAAAVDWQKYDSRSHEFVPSDPPPRVVQLLLKGRDYPMLSRLRGIARQPYLDLATGELINKAGYNPSNGIFASFNPADYPLAEPTLENAKTGLRELKWLLREFHFASPEDEAAALSALLLATVRTSLPLAPAVNLTATTSGSGKSYLARVITLFAGPGEPVTMSYPASSEEAGKAMLAALMPGPAAILFDDMQHDWQPHGVMNRLLTSTTISDRLLSTNRIGTARTQSLIVGTGNNIAPVRDMIRRVMTVRLAPPSSSPATLQYSDRPLERLLAERGTYVAHALTIIRAWLHAGSPKADLRPLGSFEQRSDLCRQPLAWLGLPDPASSLLAQLREDPDLSALAALLDAWSSKYWSSPVPVRKVIKDATANPDGRLHEALMDLPVTERGYINASKLGWYLRKNAGRIAGGLAVQRVDASERTAWKVVESPDRTDRRPPSPPSPPSPPILDDDDEDIGF